MQEQEPEVEVKKFIQKGKVQVNGVPAKKSEIKVSEEDEVVLDGNRISQAPKFCLLSSAQTGRVC